ncbi:uncharacterized protein LOC112569435 isoform X1 [Pomacea canaliculata]|uniref:uncharacterized protein LOC112569435 isoform X1 n=1 Tax=Pomacea canaliculata TaxID=400727 RepID=UPI000D73221E|nr:uncharacterized protein LOC112569435 isoform X1 [Pomacea canaliculata]
MRCMRAMAVRGRPCGGYLVVCKVLFLYLSTSQGSPTLTILNATDPLVLEPNTTLEVLFSLKDVGSDNLTYAIFVNHKAPGSNISFLKCVLQKTPENCSSTKKECKCSGGHEYSLKKGFQEKDMGEWTFTTSVKKVSTTATINIARQGHLTIDNHTDPIVVQEGQKFDILFSLHEVPLPYRIIILHRATNSNVPHLTCVLFVSRDNYTTSDSETCRPLTQEARRHVYKLTKTFSLHESGELIFQVMNKLKKQQNIIVKRSLTTPAEEEIREPSNDVTSPGKASIQTSPEATFIQSSPDKTVGLTSPRNLLSRPHRPIVAVPL